MHPIEHADSTALARQQIVRDVRCSLIPERASLLITMAANGIGMSRRGVLSGWYPAAAAMVIFALVPALALSGALLLASPMLAHLLQMSSESRGLASGMAAAAAPDPGMFIAGHVLQGLCTSLLLIAAMPSLALTTATPSL